MSASQAPMDKAVILARGLGTRMRKPDEGAETTSDQAAIAETGVKAMIPIDRPFLDYVMSRLADAGYKRVCLVVGPEHSEMRDYYQKLNPSRVRVEFAVQPEPLGTADAVLACEPFAGDDPFLVINSDNYYPPEALAGLRDLDSAGLAAFGREAMFAASNISNDRLTKFAVVRIDEDGTLDEIIEKPDPQTLERMEDPVCVSMNCWRFGPKIFEACRSISPSARGELELPDAVQYARDQLGERFEVLTYDLPVLDLSSRADIGPVSEKLKGVEVNL